MTAQLPIRCVTVRTAEVGWALVHRIVTNRETLIVRKQACWLAHYDRAGQPITRDVYLVYVNGQHRGERFTLEEARTLALGA